MAEALRQAPAALGAARVDLDRLDELPAPVARYLRHVLRPGQGVITWAELRQTGTLRADALRERWLRFDACQQVAPGRPGFLWDARVSLGLPLLHLRVRDAFIDGQGSGQVSLGSAFRLAAAAGTPEMNSGALHRFLAEAVWYPTALLPSAALRWSALSDDRALATLTAQGVTVALEFRFNAADEVSGIYTPARWGAFDGGYRQLPWEGHFSAYEDRGGVIVPTRGEVGWHLQGQWRRVWQGSLTQARYAFADRAGASADTVALPARTRRDP